MLKSLPDRLRSIDPMTVGFGCTAGWFVLVLPYLFWKVDLLKTGGLQDHGQLAQGVFAPVAFLWLVVAVFLQKNELGLQREELVHSRKALELQAEELRALVHENKQAVEVAHQNLLTQQERVTEERLHQMLDRLAKRVLFSAQSLAITVSPRDGSVGAGVLYPFGSASDITKRVPNGDPDMVMRYATSCLPSAIDQLRNRLKATDPVLAIASVVEIEAQIMLAEALWHQAYNQKLDVVQARVELMELKRFTERGRDFALTVRAQIERKLA